MNCELFDCVRVACGSLHGIIEPLKYGEKNITRLFIHRILDLDDSYLYIIVSSEFIGGCCGSVELQSHFMSTDEDTMIAAMSIL